MNFAFSEEQEQLRDAVRQVPGVQVARDRGASPDGDDRGLRPRGVEADGPGARPAEPAIPEEYGGQGFTFIELGIVLEEMGRVLLCAPYFSTVVLAAERDPERGHRRREGRLLPGIASGDTIAALAFTEPSGKWDAAGITMEAKGSGDSGRSTARRCS